MGVDIAARQSALGHAGAGNFGNDVLVFAVGADGRVELPPATAAAAGPAPTPRGWTDMAVGAGNTLVLYGGLAGTDDEPRRLGDVSVLAWHA